MVKILVQNLGKIFKQSKNKLGCLTPTPVLLKKNRIRIFFSIIDKKKIGRIYFIDVDSNNPKKILYKSKKPILNLGKKNTFDSNGMILGDVIYLKEKYYLYYVGFKKIENNMFQAYSGLAISKNCENFKKYIYNPIMKNESKYYFQVLHSYLKDKKFYYFVSCGSSFKKIKRKIYPVYDTYLYSSKNGFKFNNKIGLNLKKKSEHRLGRARAIKIKNFYFLLFSASNIKNKYYSEYAVSKNMKKWSRHNFVFEKKFKKLNKFKFIYPAPIMVKKKEILCFYNLGKLGQGGIGVSKIKLF